MNQTHELIRTEISKLDRDLCKEVKASDEGKKFSLLMLKKLSGYKKKELKMYYCDGGGDYQIDGVYFVHGEELQINILSCCFRSNGKAIEDKDVTDLIHNGLDSLFFGKEKGNVLNDRLEKLKTEIEDLRKEYDQKFAVVVKFICTSDKVLSDKGENAFLAYQSDLQSKNFNIEYEKINDKQISALLSSRVVLRTPIPIKLSGKSYYQLVGREGFICRLPVKELINIYFGFTDEKKYPGYGDFLFEDNVRKNLGLERKINKDIYTSATDQNKAFDFEYFNNGLTIIYDEKTGALTGDSPVLCMKGLQVVNGCQTINTLIKAHEDSKLSDDIYVTCRFIKRSGDQEFIQSVITYTNSQNQISDRDLHANDRIQYDIQGILKNIGISYERKLNEFREREDDVRLDALDAAQAYLCCELQEPHQAKQSKRKLFNEMYHRIFDDSKTDLAYKLLLSYRFLEYVLEKQLEAKSKKQKIKKQGKTPRYRIEDLVVAHGSYHLAAILYKELFLTMSKEDIAKQADNFKFPVDMDVRYKKARLSLTKDIKSDGVLKEKIPQYFKSKGIR